MKVDIQIQCSRELDYKFIFETHRHIEDTILKCLKFLKDSKENEKIRKPTQISKEGYIYIFNFKNYFKDTIIMTN